MTEIGEIWNKHPSELTTADVDQIVVAYQAHMASLRALVEEKRVSPQNFKKNGERKKIRGRKPKAKADPAQLDLDDLIKETAK